MSILAALPLGLFLWQAAHSAPPRDALALLNEVSQRYADAKSYHVEAAEERTSSTELSRHWDKTLMTAVVASDGRYRYEAKGGFGGAVLVSDGTTRWDYHPLDHLYTQQPASGNDPLTGRPISSQEYPVLTAKGLITQLAHRADRVESATYLPDEAISVNGKSAECYVVHFFDDPSHRNGVAFEWTLWIDKSSNLVLKTLSRGEGHALTLARGRIPISNETAVTYSVVQLDQPEPASSFAFVPPSDAKLVAEFPNYFASQKPIQAAEMEGKPAPEIEFKSSEGKATALSSYRGKPVFIDFWATSCAPCVALFPALNKLYAETAGKGLAWIGVDSDADAATVATFLSREHVAWPNYHDEGRVYGEAFHRVAIPLGVLIDATGKITFYKSGYGIGDLRAAVAKLGPEFASVAKAGETGSSNAVKTAE